MNKEKKKTNVWSWLLPVILVPGFVLYFVVSGKMEHKRKILERDREYAAHQELRKDKRDKRKAWDDRVEAHKLKMVKKVSHRDVEYETYSVAKVRRRVRDSSMSEEHKTRAYNRLDDHLEDFTHMYNGHGDKVPDIILFYHVAPKGYYY